MKRTHAIAACLAALSLSAHAAGTFPSHPVTFVVPFPPGGGVDPVARLVGTKLAEKWGQPVIVSNRPGASGNIGSDLVARAAPDGHTLLVTTNSFLINPHVLSPANKAKADAVADFKPVAMLSTTPLVALVHPSVPARNLADLAALARKEPGLLFAGSGNGSPMHMAGELFKKAAGVSMTYSPYRGIGLAMNDVLGGHVKVIFVGLAGGKAQIDSGKLVPLATLENRRTPLLPEVPTAEEQGFPGTLMDAWFGMYGPRDLPPGLVARINEDVNAVLKDPAVAKQLAEMSQAPEPMSPSAFAAKVKADYDRYGRIIRDAHIQPE
ncbi:Bug family tripartite tricarboxylate transporter substrate binding protein [Pigmentiphaga kullae]|uniref:Tripartite-type tricarboxylate transporter receptor subunit TctC n=1 Tax=Pigmentiphaga kullae TaxID=151784 RepID=A0A4Q7NIL8_9BURK|nr:tripartite tricarboxylate transporter substrate binding protein [Pigmentiphaga kullae]RZS84753.1 tripartite-type tricarboxylate transporter receptor subunit TctC [Pigmentiphaga kullae]